MPEKIEHPRGLYVLFFTEMWERFSYYGMRALLILYLTTSIVNNGFEFTRTNALEIYAIFTGLIYFTPLLGGYLSDKYLGPRKSVYIGAITMAIGHGYLAFSQFGAMELRTYFLYTGLGLLILGTGFFKPSMPSLVGNLYKNNDKGKDSAFTIFYMGINIGAFLAPIIAGALGERLGWVYGFSAAGIGMLIGVIWFHHQSRKLEGAGLPPGRTFNIRKRNQLTNRDVIDIIGYIAGLVVFVCAFLKLWSLISINIRHLIVLIIGISLLSVLVIYIISNTKGKSQWNSVVVIIILCLFNIFFWMGYEQAGGTFNLFAAEKVDRVIFLGEIPASVFQATPALFVIALAPVFSFLWTWLSSRGKDLNAPVKFSIALLFLGLGFIIMTIAGNIAGTGIKVSPMWIISVYFVHTIGELCLSPIGLSMISKLSPVPIVSIMMGLWYACTAMALYLAGTLESLLNRFLPSVPLYGFLTYTSIGAGMLLLLLTPVLARMMKAGKV